ncbi:MAG: hypothetical protein R3B13_09275 [Polyangiaceae bacterium]
MSREDEITIVQYFTDMAGIERLAGALFEQQRKNAEDPVLRDIFATFVRDEVRHAQAAQMLADYYDVHKYRVYQPNEALMRFTPHFVNAVRFLPPEIANTYITSGELILDVALLRSISDHVDDKMSDEAMELINRDESRHIAMDFHMVDYYATDAYKRQQRARPRLPLRRRAAAAWAFANVLYFAAPFFRDVFFVPMRHVDPTGKRLRQAFKRIQLLGIKDEVRDHPFTRFMTGLQDVYNEHPAARVVFGRLIRRVLGVDESLIARLYDEADVRRVKRMSFDEMAQDALGAKLEN